MMMVIPPLHDKKYININREVYFGNHAAKQVEFSVIKNFLKQNRTIAKSKDLYGRCQIRMINPNTAIGPFNLHARELQSKDLQNYKSDVEKLKTMSDIVNLYKKYELPLYRYNKSVYKNNNQLKTAIRKSYDNKIDLYLEKEYEKMLNAYSTRSARKILRALQSYVNTKK